MAYKRIYYPSISNLENLPLAGLTADYEQIKEHENHSRTLEGKRLLRQLQLEYVTRYNATNEAAYEGDFSELNLDASVAAKLPSMRGLSKDAEKQVSLLIQDFSKKFALKKNYEWFFGQMMAKFAQLPLAKNDKGLYSAKQLVLKHIRKSPELTALWLIARHPSRSDFLDKQTDPNQKVYSSLVPLIMSAFKRISNIPYKAWEPSEISGITDPNLASVMLVQDLPKMDLDELLDIRSRSLMSKGTMRPATSTYSVYTPAGTPLSGTPTLLRIMLFQTWCAHPANRSDLMILDPLDWDHMPEPLVTGDVIHSNGGASEFDTSPDWAV